MTTLNSVAETVGDTVRTAVTDAESKVTGAVRDVQAPVMEYVHKGIAFASERLPDYPSSLPTPSEVIDSQYEFVTTTVKDGVDRVKAVATKVAPHVGITVAEPSEPSEPAKPSTRSAKATKTAKTTKTTKASKKSS